MRAAGAGSSTIQASPFCIGGATTVLFSRASLAPRRPPGARTALPREKPSVRTGPRTMSVELRAQGCPWRSRARVTLKHCAGPGPVPAPRAPCRWRGAAAQTAVRPVRPGVRTAWAGGEAGRGEFQDESGSWEPGRRSLGPASLRRGLGRVWSRCSPDGCLRPANLQSTWSVRRAEGRGSREGFWVHPTSGASAAMGAPGDCPMRPPWPCPPDVPCRPAASPGTQSRWRGNPSGVGAPGLCPPPESSQRPLAVAAV